MCCPDTIFPRLKRRRHAPIHVVGTATQDLLAQDFSNDKGSTRK